MEKYLNKIIQGDCLEIMKDMPDKCVDSVVTDPPYGLSFMGKKWDYAVPSVDIWKECLRVLKPGGYLLSFAGTRTQHRMAVNIEDAGFEIRDMIAWVYGSGFPKSLNIGKAVDKLQGNEREDLGYNLSSRPNQEEKSGLYEHGTRGKKTNITKGTSEYEGWGTALKPALEPITVARKPLSEKTVASNVLKWGTGGINIDESRVGETGARFNGRNVDSDIYGKYGTSKPKEDYNMGRFPANFIHDGSDEVVRGFPDTKPSKARTKPSYTISTPNNNIGGGWKSANNEHNDSGSASRFFYCAKASKSERNKGCEGLEIKQTTGGGGMNNTEDDVCGKYGSIKAPANNHHPTVKPLALRNNRSSM
jgi:hypothetical protein